MRLWLHSGVWHALTLGFHYSLVLASAGVPKTESPQMQRHGPVCISTSLFQYKVCDCGAHIPLNCCYTWLLLPVVLSFFCKINGSPITSAGVLSFLLQYISVGSGPGLVAAAANRLLGRASGLTPTHMLSQDQPQSAMAEYWKTTVILRICELPQFVLSASLIRPRAAASLFASSCSRLIHGS